MSGSLPPLISSSAYRIQLPFRTEKLHQMLQHFDVLPNQQTKMATEMRDFTRKWATHLFNRTLGREVAFGQDRRVEQLVLENVAEDEALASDRDHAVPTCCC